MKGFRKTRVPNLVRHLQTGNYYARVRVGAGREVIRSLGADVESVAKLKLAKKLAEIRAKAGRLKGGNLTLGECEAVYLAQKRDRGYRRKNQTSFRPLAGRSLDYRQETCDAIRKQWPDFDTRKAHTVTEADCQRLADRLRKRYSPSRFNGCIQSLRGILGVAVEAGELEDNPAAAVGFSVVRPAEKILPSREQFTTILGRLDSDAQREFAALSVRALAFTGLRSDEARHLKPADVDLKSGTLTARKTKNGEPRTIPLIRQAIELFEQEGVGRVLKALRKSPRRALRTIGAKLGLHLTPHLMRHMYGTRALECGVDLPTVAGLLGHKDRGVTLARTYWHQRMEHSQRQVRKITV